MKHTYLTILFCVIAGINGTISAETYYYDSDFKGVASKEFCTYYRIVSRSKQFGNKTRLFDSKDNLISEGGFKSIDKMDDKKTVLHGEYKSYYYNGNVRIKSTLVNGYYSGDYYRYLGDGTLEIFAQYKDGYKNGQYIEYYPNGNIHIKCNYADSQLSGDYYKYFNDGKLAIFAQYKNEVLNGKYTEYYSNGHLAKSTNYLNGREHGTRVIGDAQNRFRMETEYDNGNYASDYSNAEYDGMKYRLKNSDRSVAKEKVTPQNRIDGSYGLEKYAINGIQLSIQPEKVTDYGRYIRYYISIDNCTPNIIHIEPSDITSKVLLNDTTLTDANVLSPEQYQSKIEARQMVGAIFLGLLMGAASSLDNSNGTATVDVTTNYVDQNDRVVATTKGKVEIYDPELARLQVEEQAEAVSRMSDRIDANDASAVQERMEYYIQPTDIPPFSSIKCYVNVKPERKTLQHNLTFKLDGTDYTFTWDKLLLAANAITKPEKPVQTAAPAQTAKTQAKTSASTNSTTVTKSAPKENPAKKPSVATANGRRSLYYNDSCLYLAVDTVVTKKAITFNFLLMNKQKTAIQFGENSVKFYYIDIDGKSNELKVEGFPIVNVQPQKVYKTSLKAKLPKGSRILVIATFADQTYKFLWAL